MSYLDFKKEEKKKDRQTLISREATTDSAAASRSVHLPEYIPPGLPHCWPTKGELWELTELLSSQTRHKTVNDMRKGKIFSHSHCWRSHFHPSKGFPTALPLHKKGDDTDPIAHSSHCSGWRYLIKRNVPLKFCLTLLWINAGHLMPFRSCCLVYISRFRRTFPSRDIWSMYVTYCILG